ncbi:MAG: hypothetical protein HUK03_08505, partial [Bacteroidaceae bacterium]|nr:hypothetical protein [Bacteroidaceae bacterium]
MKRLEERVFKAWDELRQQRLFTIIYVAGTALAITFTMIYSLVYYVGIADIYPETNRSKTMYVDWFVTVDSTSQGYIRDCGFSKEAFDSVLYRSKNVEVA